MMNWKTLDSCEQLQSIIEASFSTPQIVFKHSTTCPISGMAKSRVERDWDLNIEPYYLDLLSFRSVSNEIADSLSVTHQSPQIIVIKEGKAIFDESHLDISVSDIHDSLNN